MPLRIAYFGLPLGALLLARDGHEIAVCALSPVARLGVRRLRHQLGARVLDPVALGGDFDKRVDQALAEARADVVVCWFFTRLIPERWLNAGARGAIGVHPSLLPRHRGPNPFFWTIDSGDRETGATVYRLGPRYDDGPILAVRDGVEVGELDSWQLARTLDRITLELLRRVIRKVADGEAPIECAQNEQNATWAPEPTDDLLRVDWTWPTRRVLARIRALSPVPGLPLEIRGREFFVTHADRASAVPGGLLPGEAAVGAERALCVATGDAGIRILRAITAEDPDRALESSELTDWLDL